ncbi:hypothetical protein HaLaN_01046 [Haematococcus lacustris]|uniref:Uncharacterized protein n=1 Tax=Haematococcus lacustris TaxID=44745 RepID=A0A699YKA8_HAELA|nr:hypothetical protein HaLaN_01046 [Haematococcus lacustris]
MAQDTAEPGAIVTTRATAPAPNARGPSRSRGKGQHCTVATRQAGKRTGGRAGRPGEWVRGQHRGPTCSRVFTTSNGCVTNVATTAAAQEHVASSQAGSVSDARATALPACALSSSTSCMPATVPAHITAKTCTAQQQPRLAKEPWCKPRATSQYGDLSVQLQLKYLPSLQPLLCALPAHTGRCAPCSKGSTLRWSPAWMNTTRPAQATV